MQNLSITVPCHFGLEAVLKKEIHDLGYDVTHVEDGRVTFSGDAEALCRANIWLRTAERVLLEVGRFRAVTFDELFEGIRALPWEQYIPKNGKFWVTKASSVKSALFSPSDIQSVVKKAVVERLKGVYHIDWFPEDGAAYPLRVFLMKDEVCVTLDTSGDSLHKRGYRTLHGTAPISETLASSLILLTPWRKNRILVDPFCGSGTFLIEAALMAANMAPGMHRRFTAQAWENLIDAALWDELREEAEEMVDLNADPDLQGYDADGSVLRAARENADRAGVGDMIHFQQRPVKEMRHAGKYGFVITNPPYGERMEEKEALPRIYGDLADAMDRLNTWSLYLISSYAETERYLRRKAVKKRKVYNGMIRADFYMMPGPRPPKRTPAWRGGSDRQQTDDRSK